MRKQRSNHQVFHIRLSGGKGDREKLTQVLEKLKIDRKTRLPLYAQMEGAGGA